MNGFSSLDKTSQDIGYFIFMDRGEKTVLCAKGVLDGTIKGYLVLTDQKLFFFFWSNINRDKKFIATYPYLVSAEIKQGLFSSTVTVSSRKETFVISNINKAKAAAVVEKLDSIISGNEQG